MMKDFLELENKHILVTGGTSGIGRATAVLASECGARVTVVGRREEMLEETLSMMTGSGHSAVPFDLSDISQIEAMVKGEVEKGGPFDGFVQSAGINKDMPLNTIKYEKIHETMLVNFYSFFELVRVISRKGRFNPGLSIVGISSISARVGIRSHTAYGASKAAMNGTMRAMARELAGKGIRVNTILPGRTDTEMYRNYLELKESFQEKPQEKREEPKQTITRSYLGMNKPVDVANAAVFLLSPASRMITGVELPVDAGFTSC
ncbi:MAG: SDR family oxidoreductase [Blautia sp.]|nr:SDR family oxidoreductase [Blautia sp.]